MRAVLVYVIVPSCWRVALANSSVDDVEPSVSVGRVVRGVSVVYQDMMTVRSVVPFPANAVS